MKTIETDPGQGNFLRVVFCQTMVTLNLPANATFGDIARTLGKLSERHCGRPADIRVTLGPVCRTSSLEMFRRLPLHSPSLKGNAPAHSAMLRPASQALAGSDDRERKPEEMRNANLLRSAMVAFVLATTAAGCAAISGQETAGEYLDDTTITTRVKASIINELGMKQIGVETMQNVVQLSGFVDSPLTRTRAGDIARGVSGVRDVRNNLIVQ